MANLLDRAPTVEKPFFEGCREGILRLQRCGSCGHYQFYPRLMCEECWHRGPDWVDASGRGRIESFTVVRLPVSSSYDAPYVAALVRLEEGPTMMSHITGCEPEEVKIGAGVRVAFIDIADYESLPVFQLQNG